MSLLTCPEVEARLDLFVVGECDAAEAEIIRDHLAHCRRCGAVCEEARQVIGLLDLRLQEPERLRRLERRIAAEAEPRRRVVRFPTKLRRVVALAALLLLTVGPIGWLMPNLGPAGGDVEFFAVLPAEAVPKGPAALIVRSARERAMKGDGAGHWPEPPVVDLPIELRNTTDRTMRVCVAGPAVQLHIDLHGPGAASVPAGGTAAAAPRIVTLRPGESYVFHITRLTDGRHSWYWTKPGEYTVLAQITTRAWVEGLGQRRLTVRSEPLEIPVAGD
jgi:hypothetical protein